MASSDKVNITITTGITPGDTTSITLDNDPISLKGLPVGSNAPITWTISGNSTPGWTFSDNGIDIHDSKAQGQPDVPALNSFEKVGKDPLDARNFKWNRRVPGNDRKYKYTVNVMKGTETLSLDPIIINEP